VRLNRHNRSHFICCDVETSPNLGLRLEADAVADQKSSQPHSRTLSILLDEYHTGAFERLFHRRELLRVPASLFRAFDFHSSPADTFVTA